MFIKHKSKDTPKKENEKILPFIPNSSIKIALFQKNKTELIVIPILIKTI